MPSPMPLLPPVTKATLSFNSFVVRLPGIFNGSSHGDAPRRRGGVGKDRNPSNGHLDARDVMSVNLGRGRRHDIGARRRKGGTGRTLPILIPTQGLDRARIIEQRQIEHEASLAVHDPWPTTHAGQ